MPLHYDTRMHYFYVRELAETFTLYDCRGLGRRNNRILTGQENTYQQHSAAYKTSLCIINTVAISCLTGTVPRVPPSMSSPAGGRVTAWTGLVVTCPVLLLALP